MFVFIFLLDLAKLAESRDLGLASLIWMYFSSFSTRKRCFRVWKAVISSVCIELLQNHTFYL